MNSFKGLVQKEWLIGKSTLLWLLVAQVGFVFISFLVSKFLEVAGLFYMCTWVILFLQPFIMFSLIFGCLNYEGKTQLWIHNPQSAAILLGSKLLSSVLFQVVSILFASCLVIVAFKVPTSYFQQDFQVGNITELGGLLQIGGVMTAVSIGIAVLMMFLWVVYHALARIQFIKNIRWLLVSLLFIGMVLLKNWVGHTMVYQKLDDIWAVPAFSGSSFSLSQAKLEFYIESGGNISLLTSGLDVIGLVILFLASCWLLDRKIEV
ncbi:hypothetical protein QUF86_14180 [Peribacillus sp. NJ11]|uniref:hypothetical protein n=1 Tax=Peribacillus sp. NJ11 TaxID=3055861 RepID=UPI0025A061D2|nr:hypothetical protein [Peribacillus sp. NJ11]MDM5221865.1 hypothetical protein [Peribacillus sp. NJ11]